MKVKIFKLSNNEDIICQVIDEIEYTIKHAMFVKIDNTNNNIEMVLRPWISSYIVEDTESRINPSHIVCEMEPTEDLIEYYLTIVENITMESKDGSDMMSQAIYEAVLEAENTKNLVIH